jgi:hypothetical protein
MRNLAKPFRPVRLINDKPYELDTMRMGPKGQSVNTTGCFGVQSTYGVRGLSIVNRKIAPGKHKGAVKKKNGSRLISARTILNFDRTSLPKLLNIRNDLVFLKALNGLSEDMDQVLNDLTDYMLASYGSSIKKFDEQRIRTAKGMIGKIQVKPMNDLKEKINRALAIMGG